jgi:hypothetical protein
MRHLQERPDCFFLFFSAQNFTHRAFIAFEIFALGRGIP